MTTRPRTEEEEEEEENLQLLHGPGEGEGRAVLLHVTLPLHRLLLRLLLQEVFTDGQHQALEDQEKNPAAHTPWSQNINHGPRTLTMVPEH